MKTTLIPTAAWPKDVPKVKRVRVRMPRPKVYAKKQPITEVDYLREAREQLAEMKRKREQQ
jgi:hypothetical protein